MNPWGGWQSGFEALNDHGARNYWKSHHLKEIPDKCINTIVEFAEKMPFVELRCLFLTWKELQAAYL